MDLCHAACCSGRRVGCSRSEKGKEVVSQSGITFCRSWYAQCGQCDQYGQCGKEVEHLECYSQTPHIGHTSSKQTVRISLTSKHQRCGDLSEVDKPSTWELGPRILQVRTHFKEEVEMISYFHFHLSKLIGSKNVPKITVRKIEKTS